MVACGRTRSHHPAPMASSRSHAGRSRGGPLLIYVETYPPIGIDRRSREVAEFRAAAAARVVPGMTLSTGPNEVAAGIVAPLIGFGFGEEHIPQPFEDILAWLRQHELVRLIEIERTILAGDARIYDPTMNSELARQPRQLTFIPGEPTDLVFVTSTSRLLRLLARMLTPLAWTVLTVRRQVRRLIRMARHVWDR